jgi:hypothetical protein
MAKKPSMKISWEHRLGVLSDDGPKHVIVPLEGLQHFKDSYKASYSNKTVYGRQDPIVVHTNTMRVISMHVSISAQANSLGVIHNMWGLQRALYKTYSELKGGGLSKGVYIPQEQPLFKLQFGLSTLNEVGGIKLGSGDFAGDSPMKKLFGSGTSKTVPMFGVRTPLFGFFNEFSLEISPTSAENVGTHDSPNYQPATLELQTEFTVVHHYARAPRAPGRLSVADAGSPVVETTMPA